MSQMLPPSDIAVSVLSVVTLFRERHDDYGVIKIELWPEGLVIWVGGEIRWRSFDWPRADLDDAREVLVEMDKIVATKEAALAAARQKIHDKSLLIDVVHQERDEARQDASEKERRLEALAEQMRDAPMGVSLAERNRADVEIARLRADQTKYHQNLTEIAQQHVKDLDRLHAELSASERARLILLRRNSELRVELAASERARLVAIAVQQELSDELVAARSDI